MITNVAGVIRSVCFYSDGLQEAKVAYAILLQVLREDFTAVNSLLHTEALIVETILAALFLW